MKIEIELPEIEGFEYTGEKRDPILGEFFLDGNNSPRECITANAVNSLIILRKLKPKREFIEGAFYPVKWDSSGNLTAGRQIARMDIHGLNGEVRFYILNGGWLSEDQFSWIGEELVIDWGEG